MQELIFKQGKMRTQILMPVTLQLLNVLPLLKLKYMYNMLKDIKIFLKLVFQ